MISGYMINKILPTIIFWNVARCFEITFRTTKMTEFKKWFYIPWITTFLFEVFSLYEIIFLDFNKFRRILNLFRIFSFFELIFLGSFNEFFRIWNLWDVCSLFEIILFGSFNGIKFIGPGASLEVRQPSICLRQILRI